MKEWNWRKVSPGAKGKGGLTRDLDWENITAEKNDRTRYNLNELYEWWEWALGVIIFVVLLLSFIVRTVMVDGSSMDPTLVDGDNLLVTRLSSFEAGDIVAITQPNRQNIPLIKRIIATEGQTIEIDENTGDVIVDGVVLNEPYIAEPIDWYSVGDHNYPVVVPAGRLFVMGDNRNHSWDSRDADVGFVDTRYVLGKVLVRFMPFDSFQSFISGKDTA